MKPLLATFVITATLLPVPRYGGGGSCPFGYLASGGYCVPSEGTQEAIPRAPGQSCPWGWTGSGNFCLKSGARPAPVWR
jgi:hypothetical protein